MMGYLLMHILAARDPDDASRFSSASESVWASHAHHAAQAPLIQLPDHWPGQLDLVNWCGQMGPALAGLLIVAGVIYLLWGFKIFKTLMIINAIVVGAVIGAIIGDRLGAVAPVAVVGAVLGAAITWPTMKYAVAVKGAAFGTLLGATVWHSVGLDPKFAWSGAAIGLVTCGLLCFIVFRGCLVMFTSLQGAVMLIFGLLGLVLKYEDASPHVGRYLTLKPFLLPLCIFIPAVVGMLYQQATPGVPKPPGQPPKK
jgi:hypothetical protein